MLRPARNPIDCAFGRLEAKWSITSKLDVKLEKVATFMYACLVLHNYCESQNFFVDTEQVKIKIDLLQKMIKYGRHPHPNWCWDQFCWGMNALCLP